MGRYPANTTRAKDEALSEIRQHIESRGEYPLSDKHLAIKTRLEKMWAARQGISETFKTRPQILAEHAEDCNVHFNTAVLDWQDCEKVFQQYTQIDAQVELYLTFREIKEIANEAGRMGKLDTALAAQSKAADIIQKLAPDPNKPDFNKQIPHVTALVLDPFTQALFDMCHKKMGDPDFYKRFLKLVLDIDDPLTFNFSDFMTSYTEGAEVLMIENIPPDPQGGD